MKMTKWIVAMLMAGVLAFAGCSKTAKVPETVDVNGVKVAMPALQQSLTASTDKDIQGSIAQMAYGLRYRNYPAVQAELVKLAANPSLSEAPKKLVATVDEQMKQVVAAPAPEPAQ
jgi:hypothetical protein